MIHMLIAGAVLLAPAIDTSSNKKLSDAMFEAIGKKDAKAVSKLLHRDPALLNRKSGRRLAFIQYSAYASTPEITNLLVKHTKSVDFYSAVVAGLPSVAEKQLLKDPLLVNKMSPDGATPLCLAVAMRQPKVAELLLKYRADVNLRSKGYGGVQPIHSAVFGDDIACVKLMVASGADVRSKQEGGYTALHESASKGSLTIVEVLVEAGADVNAKADNGDTPLSVAQTRKRTAVATYLKAKGAG